MILLVLASWALCSAAIVLLGLTPALIWSRTPHLAPLLRRSIWWGLLTALVAMLVVGFRVPLASAPAAAALALVLLAAAITSAVLLARHRPRRATPHVPAGAWFVRAALGLAILALAAAALGPVTNYDTGLYHLGAIRYAADFATIPGLANLYFPFGYGNSLFPLAALLGNGPWGSEGFRLANGLIIVLVCLDLALRVRSRHWSPGTWVLLVGAVAGLAPMLLLADYWVTSPSQDAAVLVISLVSGAYLVDAIAGRRASSAHGSPSADAAVALVTAAILVTMRPLMGVFALVTAAIAVSLLIRRGGGSRSRWAVLIAVLVLTAGVQVWRDRLLSGWIGYPLSFLPIDVVWRAPAADLETAATLWAARDPVMTQSWQFASGYGWVGSWLTRLPQQWEFWLLALLYLAALVALLFVRRIREAPRHLGWAMLPAAATVVVWFLATPPSFRFAWGPLILLGAVPLGWCLHDANRAGGVRTALPVIAALVLGMAAVGCAIDSTAIARTQQHRWQLGWIDIAYQTAPLPMPEVRPIGMGGGLEVQYPVGTDQCWRTFPLCTGQKPTTIHWRTPMVIQDGFTP